MHGLFPPSSLRIYLQDFVRISDFPVYRQVIRPERPRMRFLYVGSGFCLGPLSAVTLTGITLPLTSGSLLRARRGLSPPRIHKTFVDGIQRFQPCVLGTRLSGRQPAVPGSVIDMTSVNVCCKVFPIDGEHCTDPVGPIMCKMPGHMEYPEGHPDNRINRVMP